MSFPRLQLFCSSKLGTCGKECHSCKFLSGCRKSQSHQQEPVPLLSFRCGCWRKRIEATAPAKPCSPTAKEGLIHSLPVALWILQSSLHSEAFSPDIIVNMRQSIYSTPAYYLKTFFWVERAVVFYSFQVQGCQEPGSSVSWRRAQNSWSVYNSSTFIQYSVVTWSTTYIYYHFFHLCIPRVCVYKLCPGTEFFSKAYWFWLFLRLSPSPAIREAKFLHVLSIFSFLLLIKWKQCAEHNIKKTLSAVSCAHVQDILKILHSVILDVNNV